MADRDQRRPPARGRLRPRTSGTGTRAGSGTRSGSGTGTAPGRASAATSARSSAGQSSGEQSATAGSASRRDDTRHRPRLTGRSAALVLVVAVLAVSYASSMRAYLDQRSHIGDLKTEIVERQASIADLRREQERWDDPAYAEQQARERFGYVMPGETSYVVLDENGDPLEPGVGLGDTPTADPDADLAWWDRAWSSIEVAGERPEDPQLPATRVGAGQ